MAGKERSMHAHEDTTEWRPKTAGAHYQTGIAPHPSRVVRIQCSPWAPMYAQAKIGHQAHIIGLNGPSSHCSTNHVAVAIASTTHSTKPKRPRKGVPSSSTTRMGRMERDWLTATLRASSAAAAPAARAIATLRAVAAARRLMRKAPLHSN